MSSAKKWLYIEYPTGELFKLDARFVAEDRARYYAQKVDEIDSEEEFENEVEYALSEEYELIDWLHGSMDWEDVEDEVERVEREETDFSEMWLETDVSLREEDS